MHGEVLVDSSNKTLYLNSEPGAVTSALAPVNNSVLQGVKGKDNTQLDSGESGEETECKSQELAE